MQRTDEVMPIRIIARWIDVSSVDTRLQKSDISPRLGSFA